MIEPAAFLVAGFALVIGGITAVAHGLSHGSMAVMAGIFLVITAAKAGED